MRELAREIGHPYTLAYAGHHTSWLYHCLKLPNEMLAINDDTLRLSTEHGFPLFQATSSIYLGAASLLQGTAAAPLPLLIDGLDRYRAIGSGLALPFYLSLIGEACAAQSKYRRGRQNTERRTVDREHDRRTLPRSRAASHKGRNCPCWRQDPNKAEERFLKSLATAKRQQSKAWQLRTKCQPGPSLSFDGTAKRGRFNPVGSLRRIHRRLRFS